MIDLTDYNLFSKSNLSLVSIEAEAEWTING